MDDQKMKQAQHILNTCEGNLSEAMSYAAFRHAVASVIRETWPHTLTHRDAQPKR